MLPPSVREVSRDEKSAAQRLADLAAAWRGDRGAGDPDAELAGDASSATARDAGSAVSGGATSSVAAFAVDGAASAADRNTEPAEGIRRADGRTVRAIAAVVAVAMVLAGWWWWQGRPREVTRAPAAVVSGQPVAEKVTASPSPAVREVVVHVVGEVVRPGLVRLPAGSRVADAVGAAGGLRPGGHLGGANLARVLVDGEQLVIGAGALPGRTTTDPDTVPGRTTTGPGTGAANAPLDLNAATTAQLEELPGIGPVLAGRIVAWREEHGAFTAVTELQEVSGVGDKVFAAIERLVRV